MLGKSSEDESLDSSSVEIPNSLKRVSSFTDPLISLFKKLIDFKVDTARSWLKISLLFYLFHFFEPIWDFWYYWFSSPFYRSEYLQDLVDIIPLVLLFVISPIILYIALLRRYKKLSSVEPEKRGNSARILFYILRAWSIVIALGTIITAGRWEPVPSVFFITIAVITLWLSYVTYRFSSETKDKNPS